MLKSLLGMFVGALTLGLLFGLVCLVAGRSDLAGWIGGGAAIAGGLYGLIDPGAFLNWKIFEGFLSVFFD